MVKLYHFRHLLVQTTGQPVLLDPQDFQVLLDRLEIKDSLVMSVNLYQALDHLVHPALLDLQVNQASLDRQARLETHRLHTVHPVLQVIRVTLALQVNQAIRDLLVLMVNEVYQVYALIVRQQELLQGISLRDKEFTFNITAIFDKIVLDL